MDETEGKLTRRSVLRAAGAAVAAVLRRRDRVPAGSFRTVVSDYEVVRGGAPRRFVLPRLCNHCESPACTPVCPTEATHRRADGVVVVNNTKCVSAAPRASRPAPTRRGT
jgi:tetrathionate reductase subunit B